ncbi:MAG: hypothetical protein GF401_01950 [Chitinivibrionales bacterium]|nr:hypothetical protein [Chitinivibrionales bacterium]
MGKEKKLCKWKKKDIADHFSTLTEIVGAPRYICGKCARAATTKKCLCKPEKIEQQHTEEM